MSYGDGIPRCAHGYPAALREVEGWLEPWPSGCPVCPDEPCGIRFKLPKVRCTVCGWGGLAKVGTPCRAGGCSGGVLEPIQRRAVEEVPKPEYETCSREAGCIVTQLKGEQHTSPCLIVKAQADAPLPAPTPTEPPAQVPIRDGWRCVRCEGTHAYCVDCGSSRCVCPSYSKGEQVLCEHDRGALKLVEAT